MHCKLLCVFAIKIKIKLIIIMIMIMIMIMIIIIIKQLMHQSQKKDINCLDYKGHRDYVSEV